MAIYRLTIRRPYIESYRVEAPDEATAKKLAEASARNGDEGPGEWICDFVDDEAQIEVIEVEEAPEVYVRF
jgi:hypothetical protein